MSVLDDLLDDYEVVAEAARRLERSRGTHIGEHEFCCENGRCLKYEESFRRAEADLREALARVNPRSFPSQAIKLETQLQAGAGFRLKTGSIGARRQ